MRRAASLLLVSVALAGCPDRTEAPRPGTLGIADVQLPEATIGASYAQEIAATGSKAGAASWSLSAGSLPSGVSVSGQIGPSVSIVGQPAEKGRFDFTLAVDAGAMHAERSFTLVVGDKLTIDGTAAAAREGEPFTSELRAVGGHGSSFTWTSDGLPSGVSLAGHGASATLSGTLPAGRFQFTVNVRNERDERATRDLGVQAVSRLSITGTLPALVNGESLDATLQVQGGTGDGYRWKFGAVVPAPIVLADPDQRTIHLKGNPPVGTTELPVTVEDDNGGHAEEKLQLVVNPRLAIVTQLLPNGTAGMAYQAKLVASGGHTNAYAWTISAGSLPPGVKLDGDALSGTPTAAGSYTFSVQATTAAANDRAEQSFTISIGKNPPKILTTSLVDGTFDTPYSQELRAMSAVGGVITWRLLDGRLPPGLTLGPTIQGRPTVCGTFAFTVEANDGGGSASAKLQITIKRQDRFEIAGAVLPRGHIGQDYRVRLGTFGGTPQSWAVTSGALPPGLSVLAATGGSIAGTPTTPGWYPFELTATSTAGRTASQRFAIGVSSTAVRVAAARRDTRAPGTNAEMVSIRDVSARTPGAQIDLQPSFAAGTYPYFSPAGNWLTIRTGTAANELYVQDLRQEPIVAPTRVATGLDHSRSGLVQWSPDETRLAFAVTNPPGSTTVDWYQVDLQAAVPSASLIASGADYVGVWSPDGSRFVVTSSDAQRILVWDGAALRTIPVPDAKTVGFPNLVWTPDSRGLVFRALDERYRNDGVYFVGVTDPAAQPALLMTSPDDTVWLDASPDGGTLVVTVLSSPAEQVFAVDLRSVQLAVGTPLGAGGTTEHDWSADSTQLLLLLDHKSLLTVARDQIGVAQPRALPTGNLVQPSDTRLSWSADDKYIVYPTTTGLYEVPAVGGAPRLLTTMQTSGADSLSPQRHVYLFQYVKVYAVDAAQPVPTPVDLEPSGPQGSWPIIQPALQSAFWSGWDGNVNSVRMADLSGATPAPGTAVFPSASYFDVTP